MAKDKMTVTIDPNVRADTDDDARRAGLSRSEYVEWVLRDAHYRRLLTTAPPAPLSEDDQAQLRDLMAWQRNPGMAAA